MTAQELLALPAIARAAVLAEEATGCPAELSAAQCILESAWLSRAPGNNCFGIKADAHGAGVQYLESKEFLDGSWREMPEAFESYASLADCFTDHARLLQQGVYTDAWRAYEQDHDLDELIAGIAAHYATDPHYAAEVSELAHGPHVARALSNARAMDCSTQTS